MTRSLRLGAIWLAAVALAGGIAYFGVTAALRDTPEPSQAREQLANARRANTYAAELRALLTQVAGPHPGKTPHLTPPMLAELRAKVRQLQQEILRARMSGPMYDALLAAADRVTACAASPQTESLQTAARRALDDLEFLVHNEIERLEREVERDRVN